MNTLHAIQAQKLDALLARLQRDNAFYRNKYERAGFRHTPTHTQLQSLPFTLKSELVSDQDQHAPFGTNLTFPLSRYVRVHQTSGTTGRPLRWLDTHDSWQWWLDCWREVYEAAGVGPGERVFLAFSFGPFIGFWAAFEAAQKLGAMVIPGGGLSTEQRLQSLMGIEATVLVCTPTYALRMAEVAKTLGFDLRGSAVHTAVHAGEPGASMPNVRAQIEAAWGVKTIIDHAGATELGAWGYACGHANHMHINEAEFIAEVIDPETQAPAMPREDGIEYGELILSNLGRIGSPLIRYRTGDLVELSRSPCPCGRMSAYLRGGILGRMDHMVVIRGINVYPAALENLVRAFTEVEEFEVSVKRERGMADLVIRIEVGSDDPPRVARALEDHIARQLNLRPRVIAVDALPRYELKARRFKL